VRYYKDYAGGKDLDVFGAGADVYFGRAEPGTLESPFSGNLVEVCPTGVFTDKPYGESYTRKWDLQTAPSICSGCSVGCNISPGERYGKLKRVENRYHGEINGYFICDKGRFGYAFVNRDDRPRRPLLRREPAMPDAAIAHVAGLVKAGKAIGIGSPRASLEANVALRLLVGEANFFNGQSTRDAEVTALGIDILKKGPAPIATIRDAEDADAVLVLGEDVLATGARLALALRQATRQAGFKAATTAHIPLWQDASVRTIAQDLKSPLFNLTVAGNGLDEIAAASHRATPAGLARLGMAVAHALDGTAPVVPGLDAAETALAATIAKALLAAERPLIVSGTGCGSAAVLHAASNVVAALAKLGRKPSISLVFAEANSVGASLMDAHRLDVALERMADGEVDTLIVSENDLARRVPAERLEPALNRVKHLVVLDCIATPTVERATVVLPAGSFAETDGTLVNNEGRAQRSFQVFPAEGIRESWRWLQQVAAAAGVEGLGDTLDALTAACAQLPNLAGIENAAPNAKFRMAGAKIPRMPHRYSGRTAMNAKQDVHEPRPAQDADSPLAFSMEGNTGLQPEPAALIPMVWYPSWNSPQAVNKFQAEIGGPLRGGDPGVRLFTPDAAAKPKWFNPPAASAAFETVALHEFYGSEELSAQSPAVGSRIPQSYLAVSPATAAKEKLKDGERATVQLNGATATLPVRVRADLAPNCVGVPVGLSGVPTVTPGAAARFGGKA
jgi:NADH-quinone oxidoreductase subunit G